MDILLNLIEFFPVYSIQPQIASSLLSLIIISNKMNDTIDDSPGKLNPDVLKERFITSSSQFQYKQTVIYGLSLRTYSSMQISAIATAIYKRTLRTMSSRAFN